jgi:2-keto-4-pentenoate hydratase/2-oxohepta-3-ene-1,7-dioic acid hydratase in catechol pathway
LVDIAKLASAAGTPFPWPDLLSVITAGDSSLSTLRRLVEMADENREWPSVSETEILAPLDPPIGNVLAIGRNYAAHAGEMARTRGAEADDRPTVFTKAQTSINSPFGDIAINHKVSSEIDWEAELGVVIGRDALNVGVGEALDYVFGYTVVNDVSARDIQFGWGGQYFKGKSLDRYCPIGPWVVTADEIPDPQNLDLTLRVNGDLKQQGNTGDMIFPVADLISQLSLGMTLRAGTLIATGTPPGVGYARDPKEFLRPGDLMETEVSGIGTLRNRIVASDPGIWKRPRQPGG